MKKIFLLATVLIFAFCQNSFGSPLVFKVTKEIDSQDLYTEIATVDTSKFKQIRVRYILKDSENPVEVSFYAVENEDEMLMFSNSYQVIDIPPSKIRIKVKGKCKITVYIWAN